MTTDPLLHIVDDLTLPKPIKVPTDTGYTWATEDALLVQLQEAITSTTSRAGGRSLRHDRMILDADALMRFHQITSAIGDWCRIEGIRAHRDPVADLQAWYEARTRRPVNVRGEDDFYIDQMHAWATLIREKLTPRVTMQYLHPCPECEATTFVNDDGDTVPHPVVVDYDPDAPLETVRWTCRACSEVREGEFAQRALVYDAETRGGRDTPRQPDTRVIRML